jgi:hypothetical protein
VRLSSKPASTAAPNLSSQGIKYADCMRSHGVPNVPDPSPNGGVNLPSSINPGSPAFQSAHQACASLQPNANGPRPIMSPAQQRSFLANAKCMRKHGVPNFHDPTFGPGGKGIGYKAAPGALNASAIKLANKACASVGTPLPLGSLEGGQ